MKLAIFRQRLLYRILLYVVFTVVVFGLLMLYYVIRTSRQNYDSEERFYRSLGSSLLRGFQKQVFFDLLKQDPAALATKAEELFEEPAVAYAIVYDQKLAPLQGSYRHGLFAEMLPGPAGVGVDEEINVRKIRSKAGDAFLDFLMEARLPGTAPGSGQGYVRLGIGIEGAVRQLWSSRALGFLLIAVMLGLGTLMGVAILRNILPPLHRLADASRRIGAGDLKVRVQVVGDDELGVLTRTFNEMAAGIMDQTARLEAIINNVGAAIQTLGATTSELLGVITQQAAGASEQANVVLDLAATTEEIAATAAKIADTVGGVSAISQRASDIVYEGKDLVDLLADSMDKIRAQVENATGQAQQLSQQALLIGGVIDIIDEIGEQTSLLSLNAEIEAAAAGEAGRRFHIVATEVRKLAGRVLEATNSVRRMIEAVQTEINTMNDLARKEQAAVDEGVRCVTSVGEYFVFILQSVDDTKNSATEIARMTEQQSGVTASMVKSIHDVKQAAREVEKGVKRIESSMVQLNRITESLQGLLEEK